MSFGSLAPAQAREGWRRTGEESHLAGPSNHDASAFPRVCACKCAGSDTRTPPPFIHPSVPFVRSYTHTHTHTHTYELQEGGGEAKGVCLEMYPDTRAVS